MQLERLAIVLRPRNNWEAIDLGMRMAVRWIGPLYRAWLALLLPLVLGIYSAAAFGLDMGGVGLLIVWWLKPAYDRIALHVLSHCVFGDRPTVRQTLRAMPGIWRRSNLLRALLWGRLDFWRSLRLPVDQLEGLRGKEASARRRLITQRVGNASFLMFLTFPCFEVLLTLSFLLSAVLVLVPLDMLAAANWLDLFTSAKTQWFIHLVNYVSLSAMLVFEPLYVAGGFALYLKRRSDLEAWDIEMQLRRLADEYAERERQASAPLTAGGASPAAMLALCALLCFSPFMSSPAQAAPASEREQAMAQVASATKQVYAQPEFGKERKQPTWEWKSDDSKSNLDAPDLSLLGKIMRWISENMAAIMRIIAWIGLAIIVYLLVRLVVRNFGDWTGSNTVYIPPAEIAGLDIRPESLPKDIAAAAQQLVDAGQLRAALSLLFRGALSVLAHRDRVPFVRGDTEQECLTRVREHARPAADYFAMLTGNWQRLAYAHLTVGSAEVEQLCLAWPNYFAGHYEEQ